MSFSGSHLGFDRSVDGFGFVTKRVELGESCSNRKPIAEWFGFVTSQSVRFSKYSIKRKLNLSLSFFLLLLFVSAFSRVRFPSMPTFILFYFLIFLQLS